jgi:hypothetical protein
MTEGVWGRVPRASGPAPRAPHPGNSRYPPRSIPRVIFKTPQILIILANVLKPTNPEV